MGGPHPGESQPLRTAGFVLLGVAAIAAIIGLITLAGGGSDQAASTAGSSSASATPTAVAPPPPPSTPPPPPSTGPTTFALPGSGLPGSGLPADEGTGSKGKGSGSSGVRAPVRVYNNSLVSGLAERAAQDMRDSGWKVTDVSNWPYSNIPTSTVYYRPGTSEQAAARNLADSFGLRAEPRFEGIQDASPGIIVILTKDFQRR